MGITPQNRRQVLRDISARVSRMALDEAELRMVLSWTICEGPDAVTGALDLLQSFREENGQTNTLRSVVPSKQQTTTTEE